MHRGYFAVWRKIQDHAFYKEPREFSKLEAWLDLLMSAQHDEDPQDVILGMTVLKCHYGECLKSVQTWADRWGWNPSKVRRFLSLLVQLGQIRFKSEVQTTRIIVINFAQYDPKRRANDEQTNCIRRASDEQATTDNNDNNVKNEKNNKTPLPPKGGNGSVLKSYQYPDWLNKELWADFVKMRSRIKKPITTEQTISRLLSNLERLMASHSQDEIIQEAIDHCWQGFFPPKVNGKACDDRKWEV